LARIRVAINGYGTIGKRVADAVAKQPDMEIAGVAKTRPSFEAERARDKGFPLFVAGDGKASDFDAAGLKVAGTLPDLLGRADVVIDSTPDKIGKENRKLYDAANIRAIFQGGEKADVAEVSFNALGNYAAAKGKRRVRVVSCNTTGIARAVSVVLPRWGVERWDVTLVRRAADPSESKKGPINGILPTFQLPSHHGPDVQTIFPGLPISTAALVVPTTLMHVHVNRVRLASPPKDVGELLAAFRATPRFRVFAPWERVDGTPQVMEFARGRGLGTGDMFENVVWQDGAGLNGSDAFFFQAIHQESVPVPENVDAIRAMFELAPDAGTSIAMTDRSIGLSAHLGPNGRSVAPEAVSSSSPTPR
jgi:glyceraldehyde-3-phosphate dehydrogenase (NAD(P))